MTSAQYLESFLDSLEYLPVDLKRNFLLLADLDARSQQQMSNADQSADQLLAELASGAPITTPTKTQRIATIRESFKAARDLAEDKLQLANQSYEMVDRYIRRLDSNMAKFRADIAESLEQRNVPISDELRAYGVGIYATNYIDVTQQNVKAIVRRRVSVSSDESDEERVAYKKQLLQRALDSCVRQMGDVSVEDGGKGAAPAVVVSSVLDMAVLADEPRYCMCEEVSYGNMVACDNAQCKIEWFHFECVGLLAKPEGKWYCAKCLTKSGV